MTSRPVPDRYGVVGHPVEHSRSPLIHTVFARQTGQRPHLRALDAEPAAFETAVRGFGAAGGKGLNVTVPHKEAAFALCGENSAAARVAGAVNTISIVDGRLRRRQHRRRRLHSRRHRQSTPSARGRTHRRARRRRRGARHHRAVARASSPPSSTIANRTKERADQVVAQFAATALVARTFAELAERAVVRRARQRHVGRAQRRDAAVSGIARRAAELLLRPRLRLRRYAVRHLGEDATAPRAPCTAGGCSSSKPPNRSRSGAACDPIRSRC